MDVKITVGVWDLGSGRRFSKTECPIAAAVRRTLRTTDVSVDLDTIRVGRRQMRTPPFLADIIMRIDTRMAVAPFQFGLMFGE